MGLTETSMGKALAGLRRVAGMEVIDRLGLRVPFERMVHTGAKQGFRAATATGRAFASATTSLRAPARQQPVAPRRLFDLTPTDEQQMLQEAFRGVATDILRPAAREADDAAAATDQALTACRDLGTLQLGIPAALGGVVDDRSTITTVLAAEALAHGDMGLAAAALAPGAVATALSLWGDTDQQGRYLPAFVSDEPPVAAWAAMEPQVLADPLAPATRARRTADGFVLDGVKAFVPRVDQAQLFLVTADIDGVPALLLVEADTPGLGIKVDPSMGVRALGTGQLLLQGVQVPPRALLGGGDPRVASEALARARIAWSALAVGTGQAVLDYVIPYVNDRHAFGEPISHRQAVAFSVANIAIELDGMRLAAWRAAGLADQGKPFGRAAALAHQLVTTRAMQIGADGLQLLGGHGYIKEHPVERWYRDLRTAGTAQGALLA